jgi:hypothetical protein
MTNQLKSEALAWLLFAETRSAVATTKESVETRS